MTTETRFSTSQTRLYMKDYRKLIDLARTLGKEVLKIERAFEYAGTIYRGAARKDGSPYIAHCIEVALMLAEMDCDSDVIVAGLLHDAPDMKDCTFEEVGKRSGAEVGRIVKEAAEIKKCLFQVNVRRDENEDVISERRGKIESIALEIPNALLVAAADRIHNLRTMGSFDMSARLEAVQITNDILIPVLKESAQAYSVVDRLRDACLKAVNSAYDAIRTKYDALLMENRACLERFADYTAKEAGKWEYKEQYGVLLYFRDRSICSIYNDITVKEEDGADAGKYMNKRTVPLQDMFFIVSDQCQASPEDVFFEYYKRLHENEQAAEEKSAKNVKTERFDFTVVAFGKSKNSGHNYMVGTDLYENRWRIFCERESDFRKFRNDYGIRGLKDKREKRKNSRSSMIMVYTRSMERIEIEEDATVLDFAFKIHTDLAYGADHALINGWKDPVPLKQRIYPGDVIEIISSTASDSEEYVDKATFRWLEWVNTRRARKYLIRHLEEKEANERAKITVTDAESGRTVTLVPGASMADLCFVLNPGRALCFKEAYVGDEKKACGADRILKNMDTVRLVFGKTPNAKVSWLRYVKTDKAKLAIIDYLERKEQGPA